MLQSRLYINIEGVTIYHYKFNGKMTWNTVLTCYSFYNAFWESRETIINDLLARLKNLSGKYKFVGNFENRILHSLASGFNAGKA